MSNKHTYLVPKGAVTVEQEIKRSRFIAAAGRATDRKAAERFIREIRQSHSGATHNCWAFAAGSPTDSAAAGMSDDGEPSGTAGKPMLNVLQHSGIGEIVAVVTRYFGGIKLGTGGLVRAYASSVQLALKSLPVEEYVETLTVRIALPFANENAIRHLLKEMNAGIKDVAYGNEVVMEIEIPGDLSADFRRRVSDTTQGKAEIRPPDR